MLSKDDPHKINSVVHVQHCTVQYNRRQKDKKKEREDDKMTRGNREDDKRK